MRWLWLTHTDPDHTGSLEWLLEAAPNLTVVTTFLAVGKLSMTMPVPMHRLRWVNPGCTIEIDERRLEAVRPPSFDAPETVAFHDHTSHTFFAADSFGALLGQPAGSAGDVAPDELADGMTLWSTIDSPWVTHTDRHHFERALIEIDRRSPRRVLSSHLPPAHDLTDRLLDTLRTVPGRAPWVGPDQAALDRLLASVSSEPQAAST